MTEIRHRTVAANGIDIHLAEAGEAGRPLVLLCHGWPELWYSWRHQLPALAAAGFHAVAPDMRGFGGTTAPPAVEDYTQLHHVADMVELVGALGQARAAIVGHDWGAPVAWHAALLRPDVFHAVAGLSVPYAPPAAISLTEKMRRAGVDGYYMLYFQKEGVAEAELERDPLVSLRRFYWSLGGEAQAEKGYVAVVPPGGGLLDTCGDCGEALPGWMTAEDLRVYAEAYRRSGFRGGLNWYRNVDRTQKLLMPWRGRPVEVPALYVGGTRDPVISAAAAREAVATLSRHVPRLTRAVLLEGCGHWTQQERPREVNELLLAFLRGL